jgi:uncharacterized alkaline shock family protein YloU
VTEQRWDHLPCGRDKGRLLSIVADNGNVAARSHEATCPFCQAALEELALLWSPVRQWATRPTPPPAHLLRTIVARVKRITQSPHHVVASTAKGVTSVTTWVIGILASEAATAVPGVLSVGTSDDRDVAAGHAAVVRRGADEIEVTEVGASAVSLGMSIQVEPIENLMDLAHAVRHGVIDEIRRSADLEVTEVDISVTDINLDESF